jgi:hypothetical protein
MNTKTQPTLSQNDLLDVLSEVLKEELDALRSESVAKHAEVGAVAEVLKDDISSLREDTVSKHLELDVKMNSTAKKSDLEELASRLTQQVASLDSNLVLKSVSVTLMSQNLNALRTYAENIVLRKSSHVAGSAPLPKIVAELIR